MKIDSSNRKRPGSVMSEEQKYNQKATLTNLSDFAQVKNVVHVSARSILSPTNGINSGIVDATKVAEIKRAIIEGRFQVNSGVVADRLLETVNELIQSKKIIG